MFRNISELYSNTQLKQLCKNCRSAHGLTLWKPAGHVRMTQRLSSLWSLMSRSDLKMWKPAAQSVTTQRLVSFSSLMSRSDLPTNPFSSLPVLSVEEVLGNLQMEPATETLYKGVVDQDRASLARAITLVESSNASMRHQAQLLLTSLLQHMKEKNAKSPSGLQSFRIGKKRCCSIGKKQCCSISKKQCCSVGKKQCYSLLEGKEGVRRLWCLVFPLRDRITSTVSSTK